MFFSLFSWFILKIFICLFSLIVFVCLFCNVIFFVITPISKVEGEPDYGCETEELEINNHDEPWSDVVPCDVKVHQSLEGEGGLPELPLSVLPCLHGVLPAANAPAGQGVGYLKDFHRHVQFSCGCFSWTCQGLPGLPQ